jgi:transcriptional regulator with XRE-family HTH domain
MPWEITPDDPEWDMPGLFDFDANGFAKWLKDGYERSPFKSLSDLAKAANTNKATISRLMSGSPQTLTGKPSQPRPGLVMTLAETLKMDMAEGLELAGHAVITRAAKNPTNISEFVAALEALGIEFEPAMAERARLEEFTPEQLEELKERIKFDTEFTIGRQKKK